MGSNRLLFVAYNLLLWSVSLAAVPILLLRSRTRGMPWRRMAERFGRLPASFRQTRPGAVWLHAVSVGEAINTQRLIEELRRAIPGAPLFVSTTTPSGQAIARKKLGDRVDGIFYLPFDLAPCVRAALRCLKPRLLIVMETEIWPNLFREAKRTGAGLVIANGRISDRALPRYLRFRFFFEAVLCFCDAVMAQSEIDSERFRSLGAEPESIKTAGNLKYDFEPGAARLAPDVENLFQRSGPQARMVVAGSTREGEEAEVLRAFAEVTAKLPRSMLVLAPRHPQRCDEVAATIAASGLPSIRRSELAGASELPLPGVLLADTLGELHGLYGAADVVFVGGSLNGWGGHNVLEPALLGKPVVVGPHMQNFQAIADELLGRGAIVQVSGASELGAVLLGLLENPQRAATLGENAGKAAETQRGAALRLAAQAAQLYGAATPCEPVPAWRRVLLGPAAALWLLGSGARRAAYDRSVLPKSRLPRFTLCVGNLTAGGSGKTPTVLRLVEALARRGRNSGVLTRGYRRRSSEQFLVARPGDCPDAARLGDEAALFRRRFDELSLEVAVGVGADRRRSGEELLKIAEAGLFVLDDGFQHLRLERDFDLLLIDVTRPLELDEMLPLGRLRESLAGLARASAFLLTRVKPGQSYARLERLLKRSNPDAPIYRGSIQPTLVIDASSEKQLDLASLQGRRIVAFSGVGAPGSFRRTVEQALGQPVAELRFRDHQRYAPEDWHRIAKLARENDADTLITTEKDLENLNAAVPGEQRSGAPPLYALRIEMRIEDETDLLDLIEQRIEAAG